MVAEPAPYDKRVSRPTALSRYVVAPLALGGLLALGACGSSTDTASPAATVATAPVATVTTPSDTSSTTTPSTAATTSTTAAGRTMDVKVTGKTVTPAPAQVPLAVGETLTLTVTVDHDDELHIHGFEIEEEVKAGVPTTVQLTGKDTGVFEVELHHPELLLMTVAVN